MTLNWQSDGIDLHHGDCLEVMAGLPDASVHAVVCDPPYGLEFMGQDWDRYAPVDFQRWCAQWAASAMRVLKPGGHLLAFGGTRTFHRLTVGIEDAGFEIRDCLSWLYGQGFPKSLNVGEGRGTALKPAWEPIVMARKPLAGTVAANMLEHGTGALNIDGCRIDTDEDLNGGAYSNGERPEGGVVNVPSTRLPGEYEQPSGRWPANVTLDNDAAAMLDQQSGDSISRVGRPRGSQEPGHGWGMTATGAEYADAGGASRFFYCAKAGRDEKPWQKGQVGKERCSTCGGWEYGNPACGCDEPAWERNDEATMHPTVKPLALMRWLVRLVAPPGGTVLDPFAGTGTTGEAAIIEGMRAVLVEKHGPYLPLIVQRLSKPIQPTLLGE